MPSGITSTSGRNPSDGSGEAICESCDFHLYECTRGRARMHVALKGHVVHFTIRHITTYYPPEKADA